MSKNLLEYFLYCSIGLNVFLIILCIRYLKLYINECERDTPKF